MPRKFRGVYHVALFAQLVAFPALSAGVLLKADWADPLAVKYLKSDFAAPVLEAGQKPFLLPVLGLVEGFEEAQPAPDVEGRFIGSTSLPLDWPPCASELEQTPPVRDDTGTWYTRNYDLGCVQISINGDLNSESAPINSATDADKVLGADDGVMTISVSRFGVPYLIDVSCTDERKSLCDPKGNWQALVDRLAILEGQP